MATQSEKNKNKKSSKYSQLGPVKIPNNMFNNVFFYVFIIFTAYLLFGLLFQSPQIRERRSISDVIALTKEGQVQDITISGNRVETLLKDGTQFYAEKESNVSFDEILANNGISTDKIAGELKVEHRTTLEQIISPLLMFGLPILILFFIFRQMRSTSGEIFSFGKSKAKLFNKGHSKITFEDVAGNAEAKREMKEIVDFLKFPEKYRKLGARTPKGVLLVGSSGVGKTLLAKAIAGEAGVPFFSVAGSEFMEMLVGVGSARARDLFAMAKTSQPSLIFIDEIDAIGRQRGMGIGGGHDEREQTLNQILIEMDGFDERTDVIVVAATNRPDMLDPALVRAGRFDRKITIPLPDRKDREEIIRIHMKGKPFAESANVEKIARKTVGFSGADIENMLNEAAILAAREERTEITNADLEEASLKVTMGSERKTLQSDHERKMVAYHEAGHALVATNLPEVDPVSRISIVARGGSLGHTSFPPEVDRYNETRTRLNSLIATMLGGRAAEETVFNELTIGASDDIDRATQIARRMVTEFGMSELGPISYEGKNSGWVAKDMGGSPNYSQEMASQIDSAVKKIIDAAFTKAKAILVQKRDLLDRVALRLLEKETIDNEEYMTILNSPVEAEKNAEKPETS